MTPAEKDAIRAQPCGECGATPPFTDGSRCHPHRLIPAKGYVVGNVAPRCSTCHSQEPGRGHHLAKTSYQNIVKLNARLTREEHSANSRKAARALVERKHRAGLTPAERAHLQNCGRLGGAARAAALTADERLAIARLAVAARNAKLTPEERKATARTANRAAITSPRMLAYHARRRQEAQTRRTRG